MAVQDDRTFEITATVNFPTIDKSAIGELVEKLADAVRTVAADYPTVVAFLVAPDPGGDVQFGVRFDGADPRYIGEMSDEILERAVELVAQREGTRPIEAEREASVLVLA